MNCFLRFHLHITALISNIQWRLYPSVPSCYKMEPLLVLIIVNSIIFLHLFVKHSDCLIGDSAEQQRKVFEMKFVVPASGRYCFSQLMSTGETLSFNYAVLQPRQGQNMTIGFTLMDETNSNILISLEQNDSLDVEEMSQGFGGFELCFFNHQDSVNDKTVIFYLKSYKSHNWDNTDAEISELDVVVDSFKRSFDNTEDQIEAAVKHILGFRLRESNDLALLESTFTHVNIWSFTNCMLIGLVGILQVYFVRILFDRKTNTFQS